MKGKGIEPVQGFVYRSDEDDPRNDTICRILRRADVSDAQTREFGPAFEVIFGDGDHETVFSDDLHPWYPTE